MQLNFIARPLLILGVAGLMGLSYLAGAAQSAGTDTVNKLNSSVDFLVKARALLDASGTNRQGYGNVEKAKANIDGALKEIDKAVKANGG